MNNIKTNNIDIKELSKEELTQINGGTWLSYAAGYITAMWLDGVTDPGVNMTPWVGYGAK